MTKTAAAWHSGPGEWAEVARARELLDLLPDGMFDAAAELAARLTRADLGAVVFPDGGRLVTRGRSGDLSPAWPARSGPGIAQVGRAPVCVASGDAVGEIVVFDRHGRHLTDVGQATLKLLADQVAASVDLAIERCERNPEQGVAVIDANGSLLAASHGLELLLGWSAASTVGRNALDLVHPEEREAAARSLADTVAFAGEKLPLHLRLARADGGWCSVQLVAENRLHHAVGAGVLLSVRAARDERPMEAMVAAQLRILEMIACDIDLPIILEDLERLVESQIASSQCSTMVLDLDARTLSPAAPRRIQPELALLLERVPMEATDVPSAVAASRRQAVIVDDVRRDPLARAVARAAPAAGVETWASFPVLSSADRLPLATIDLRRPRAGRLPASDVRIIDLCCHLASLTIERGSAQARLTHQATHDPLTELPNRSFFGDRLQMALARAGDHHKVAVLFCDVDNFKVINDTLGHEVGDAVLAALADRIAGATEEGELPCRLGGDEFAVLIDPVRGPTDAVGAAERLLAAAARPFHVYGRELYVTMSIGIAISETGACAPDRLLLEADVAMYHAKARGKAHHQVFHQELLEGMLERVELEAALRRAIERDELVLHYQPKVAGATGAMVGVEALVRWQRNDTLVGPGAFIGVAEDSGLILPIGEWVIHTACAQLGDWTRRHPDAEMSMAVNVSTRQLQRDGLVAIVREALQDSGVAPERLVLELTESALEDHVDAAGETLAELKSLGVQLSIDDFGTGYSSLDRLRSFAIDELKIDRSFVEEIDHPDADAPLVTAVIAMAHGLGRRVVAEGVETHAQLRYLLVRGCDVIQGYLVGRPDVPDVVTRALSSGPDGRRAEVS